MLCALTGQDTPDWALLQSFCYFSSPYPFMIPVIVVLICFSYTNHHSVHVLSAIFQKEELNLLGQISMF